MKMFLKRKFAMVLAFVFLIPVFGSMNITTASAAATPTFQQKKVQLNGVGATYQLVIKNKVAKSKYKWSSNNTAAAKVSQKGLVTSVGNGIATIKCIITYPTKKTKTLYAKVTVTTPATAIQITNAPLVNGVYQMTLGSSADFEVALTPANTSDTVAWSVKDGDTGCIRIDDSAAGKITAIKEGTVILRATVVNSAATAGTAVTGAVETSIIIQVVTPKAVVKSAAITDTNTIQVVFDSPVQQSTVIDQNNKLSSNIEVLARKNAKGVAGADPGALTASLSTDLMTLTITSANAFSGEYAINISNKVLTTSGVAIQECYQQLSFTDTLAPYIKDVVLDESGMISTIVFSEPVDFTNLRVTDAKTMTPGATASAATISILNNTANYIISSDKRSMTVNLSPIVSSDYNKIFSITIYGIKDLAGNIPTNAYLTTIVRTDSTPKPQATCLYIRRSSYNTLTATFNRSIMSGAPGHIQINGGSFIIGVVDSSDPKKVNFTMNDIDSQSTGTRTVTIAGWSGYNVVVTDSSASQGRTFSVDFTADKVPPVLLSTSYDAATATLTLTYSEEVNLSAATGTLLSTYTSASEDIKQQNINYIQVIGTEGKNVIKIKFTSLTLAGNYVFTLNAGFVTDSFKNACVASSVNIGSAASGSNELPPPYKIEQPTPSEIDIYFANKLDKASSETVSNYSIPGITITKAELFANSSDGAVVKLTVLDGSIKHSIPYPITIKGVSGYSNVYGPISSYTTSVELKDNEKPYYTGTEFDKVNKNNVKIIFSEEIKGTIAVKVTTYVVGSTSIEIPNTVTISGNAAVINFTGYIPSNGTYLKIDILSNSLTDLNGNAVFPINTSLGQTVSY